MTWTLKYNDRATSTRVLQAIGVDPAIVIEQGVTVQPWGEGQALVTYHAGVLAPLDRVRDAINGKTNDEPSDDVATPEVL